MHKEVCGESKPAQQPAMEDDKDQPQPQPGVPKSLSGVDVLTVQQIDKLKKDPYVKKMLGSKRLQEHIRTIDSAEDRAGALKVRRKGNREFYDFVQKMMETVDSSVA